MQKSLGYTNEGIPMGNGYLGDAFKLILRFFRHEVAINVKVFLRLCQIKRRCENFERKMPYEVVE